MLEYSKLELPTNPSNENKFAFFIRGSLFLQNVPNVRRAFETTKFGMFCKSMLSRKKVHMFSFEGFVRSFVVFKSENAHFFFQGDVPKMNERGYRFILRIQRDVPSTQTLLKYFDQKSYRE